MGKLIICSGKQAVEPYIIRLTNTKIYSIEELCYYIYSNIDAINIEFFDDSMVSWMSEELELPDRAEKLRELISRKAGIKDIVVYMLCSADYYSEIEIKQLLHTIDELLKMTPLQKIKKKADSYLKYRKFDQAATEYEAILNGKDAVNLTNEEYGDLLHNLAVVQSSTVGIAIAADTFKEAYERNHKEVSLKQYLYALQLSKQEDKWKNALLEYHVSEELQKEIQSEIELSLNNAEKTEEYDQITGLKEYKKSGNLTHFYQIASEKINKWKQEYRRENT